MSAHGPSRPRVVALYLPHFCPESAGSAASSPANAVPGAWQRLAEARALFPGHEQPRAPADLGYCDLRVPEVRLAQVDLARAYGIDAFCYLHDWNAGRRRYARPFSEVLASGEPDFPFCLCWANGSQALPGPSDPSDPSGIRARADDLAHADFLAAAFADPRYLRMAGRPVFVVRQPRALADPAATLGAIRDAAVRHGAGDPLLLAAGGETQHAGVGGKDGLGAGVPAGFDGELDWPHLDREPVTAPSAAREPAPFALGNLVRHRRWLPQLAVEEERAARRRLRARAAAGGQIPVVLAGWDDTPLRGRSGTVLTGRRPELFESDLQAALKRAECAPESKRMVFVFAWNAWLQGAALEPDRRFGRGYLAAVARARIQASPASEGGIAASDSGEATGRGRRA